MKRAKVLETALMQRCMPLDDRTWLEVLQEAAFVEGAPLAGVLGGSHRPAAARARHATWLELREAGYSYSEIARVWGCDHTTVHGAVKARLAKAAERKTA
jgi:DNA invertase Pin-like site-specific DNA recombinase